MVDHIHLDKIFITFPFKDYYGLIYSSLCGDCAHILNN
jgi:hypothetical protein